MFKATLFSLLLLFISFGVQAEELKNFTLPIYGKKESFEIKKETKKYNKILINFWASWCTACIQELEELESLKKKHEKNGVLFVAVNAGEKRKKIKRFLKKHNFSYLILEDKDRVTSKSLNITDLPKTILINNKMEVLFRGNRPPKKI
ncbi:TlpA disulfide reductase family protein [Halobacteriovorax sp. JY17]|uniref:TlpA family protein disulfide reductase n=1 Tax=Halobacteriovorax sp. JY17 TaxID=2014617 RepID=UPI000C4D4263|nr:TlpA disulfide reductase family protein [Halobacteriovorax sp. JY17]PIK13972.1 MAG: hypothetical protein CES88_13390 [Halobacteriovorax sp. JY17]